MSLTAFQKSAITSLLEKKLETKLKKYSRESHSMPFLTRLIQDSEKVAAYSFIHSIATTLGMSIYEEVSKIISSPLTKECFRNYDVGGVISKSQKSTIDDILRKLRNGEKKVNHEEEVSLVLNASSEDGRPQKDGRIADLYFLRNDIEHYFEIKTVKPNIDVFYKSKSKLLEWVARRRRRVSAFLVFPYNPYYPKPYKRFTEQGFLEHNKELLIGDDYWTFIGGANTLRELLELFDKVGKEFKKKIQEKIREVAQEKMSN
ncbi:MAG TPA: TdeIII family type II restriction endonuclease [candidate division Zixibacteria bacterium]|nr:TdeIII family type II restriction endonuclease [candidate division Zixibacteria bacterium]